MFGKKIDDVKRWRRRKANFVNMLQEELAELEKVLGRKVNIEYLRAVYPISAGSGNYEPENERSIALCYRDFGVKRFLHLSLVYSSEDTEEFSVLDQTISCTVADSRLKEIVDKIAEKLGLSHNYNFQLVEKIGK